MYSKHHFPNQKPGEHILMYLHRHWVVLLGIIIVNILMALIPLVFWILFENYTNILDVPQYNALFTLLVSSFYLFNILFFFANFVDYYLDVWIVTNKRIINIEQKGLFSRVTSEKELSQMQDVTANVDGFVQTVFDFGDVVIQTAGEHSNFIFKQIPHANKVARQISNLVAEYKRYYYQNPEVQE